MGVQKYHNGEGKLEPKVIEKVVNVIAGQEHPVDIEEVTESVDLSGRKLTSIIHRLEDVGALEMLPSGEVKTAEDASVTEAARAAAGEQKRRKEMKQERLRQMQEYADISSCRREHLLRYFGDSFEDPCCNCDNCEAQSPDIQVDPSVGTRREVA